MVIAVPSSEHLSVIKEVIKYIVPSVIMCEKPLSMNITSSSKIVKICKDNGIKLFVNYFRNSIPAICNLRQAVKKLTVKEKFIGYAWYSNGFLNSASHSIMILTEFFGPIKSIKVLSNKKKLNNYDFNIDCKIKFFKGEVNFFYVEKLNIFHNTFEIFCSEKKIKFENNLREIYIKNIIKDKIYSHNNMFDSKKTKIKINFNKNQSYVFTELDKWFKNKKSNLIDGDTAYRNEREMINLIQ